MTLDPWNPTNRKPPRKVWVTCPHCAGKGSGLSCGPSHQKTYAISKWPASEFLPTLHPEGITPGVCPCDTGATVRWYPSSRLKWGEDYGATAATIGRCRALVRTASPAAATGGMLTMGGWQHEPHHYWFAHPCPARAGRGQYAVRQRRR